MGWKDSVREASYEALTGVIADLLAARLRGVDTLLDVGCGDGRKTLGWASRLGVEPRNLRGVEGYAPFRERAGEHFRVVSADLEVDRLPWPDGHFDLVIANQVLEHIKNVFHLMGELCRLTAVGGHLLLSTPNLASAHNRLLLGLGRQPTPIKVFCEHVRGFTTGALLDLATASGDLEPVATAGGGFYPFPPGPGGLLARAWKGGAVYSVVLLKRVADRDPGYWVRWASGTEDTRWAPAATGGAP